MNMTDYIKLNKYWLVLCSVVVLLIGALFIFPDLWSFFLGQRHYDNELYPFLDMHGRLAAFEAHRIGIDILYNPNPFDPMHRINVKPTWPLGLSFLGLGREHLLIAGGVVAISLCGIVFSLLRPKTWCETAILLVLCSSPPFLLAIERANDDIIYFSILSLVPLILKLKSPSRFWLVWLVIFIVAPAKYYPGAVFLVFLLEVDDWRRFGGLLAAGAIFVVAYSAGNLEEILYLREAVPKPTVFLVHGGPYIFDYLGVSSLWAIGILLLLFFICFWMFFREDTVDFEVSIESQRWFLMGYSVFSFCFLLNGNYDYRLIYLFPMFPLFFELIRKGKGGLAWGLLLLLIPVFWLDIVVMHIRSVDRLWTLEDVEFVTAVKSALLWVYFIASTCLVTMILRPNCRSLCSQFKREFTFIKLK